jgi:hypothetical protein
MPFNFKSSSARSPWRTRKTEMGLQHSVAGIPFLRSYEQFGKFLLADDFFIAA